MNSDEAGSEEYTSGSEIEAPETAKNYAEVDAGRPRRQHKHHRHHSDPRRPKAPATAFMQFSKHNRETAKSRLTSEGKQTDVRSVAVKLGEMWRSLTEEQRKPFEEAANVDKARYAEAMKHYTPPEDDSDDSDGAGGRRRKHRRHRRDPNAPKRAKTPYLVFAEANRVAVAEELKMRQGDAFVITGVMKELGRRWKELPQSEKARYEEEAAKDRRRYEAERAHYQK